MSGGLFALCTLMPSSVVSSFALWSTSRASGHARMIWRLCPPTSGGVSLLLRLTSAAGRPRVASRLSVAKKCDLVPLWCSSDAEVESWVAESCSALVGCAVRRGARCLGVELGAPKSTRIVYRARLCRYPRSASRTHISRRTRRPPGASAPLHGTPPRAVFSGLPRPRCGDCVPGLCVCVCVSNYLGEFRWVGRRSLGPSAPLLGQGFGGRVDRSVEGPRTCRSSSGGGTTTPEGPG